MSTERFQITIDGRPVEVTAGQTVLEAARRLGLDIPTLCYLERCGPLNTCLVCVVRVKTNGAARVVPSCGTRVMPGMEVESETPEVHELRRTALELLLSDHVGDCLSPCHRICPLGLNIPRMLRHVQAGEVDDAVRLVRSALPLAAVLGRLCHAPCENGCRRASCDSAAAIREVERFVAEHDLASESPWLPAAKAPTGKRVAIVGAGPAGLAAAWWLQRQGHACTVITRGSQPGGSLLKLAPAQALPPELWEKEWRQLERLGMTFRFQTELGRDVSLDELQREFDAVLLAVGAVDKAWAEPLGLKTSAQGIQVDSSTGMTSREGVFATSSAVRPIKQLVRAMSEGRETALCVHRHLMGLPVQRPRRPFSSVMARLEPAELELFLRGASPAPRQTPAQGLLHGFTFEQAREESARCLHCDCRAAGNCALQHYAELYGADPQRFPRQRRPFEQHQHPANVLFEPGKCILCGICVEIARQAAEPLGLTFVGRGFDVRVAAPFNRAFEEGLQKVAQDCVDHCPTGAITFAETPAVSAGAGSGGSCGCGLTPPAPDASSAGGSD